MRFHVATRKGLFTVERSPRGWAIAGTAFLGENCSLMLTDPRDRTLYAALEHGHFGAKVHRSRDGGTSWEEIATPVYPKPPEEPLPPPPEGTKPVPWKLTRIWSLEGGGRDQPGRVWCGTIPGGLFRSDDAGSSWELVRSLWDHPKRAEWFGGGADLPGIHSIAVDPRASRRLAVGVSCGGVWASDDDGASWSCKGQGLRAEYMPPDRQFDPNIQDPHRMVRCPASPDVLWIQHHNGVFRSTDDAASWHEIKTIQPSVFGFAVAVHPRDPDRAWFVPAIKDEQRIPVKGQVVVARTRDGGKTCEVLRDGLPQTNAYDITYRHALDIHPDGEVLAFGSTTGSVWVTENGGDSWQRLGAQLPPVYAVRFAA